MPIITKTIAESLLEFFIFDRGDEHAFSPNGRYLYLNPNPRDSHGDISYDVTLKVGSWIMGCSPPYLKFSRKESRLINDAYKSWLKRNNIHPYGKPEPAWSGRRAVKEYWSLLW